MQDTPRVRGHHLLCLMTYVGVGYTPRFVRAMDGLATHLGDGGLVELCIGPDILCATLEKEQSPCAEHCSLARNRQRDETALHHIAALTNRAYPVGARVDLGALDVRKVRDALRRLDAAESVEGLRRACVGCEWLHLCRTTSQNHFAQTRLRAAENAEIHRASCA